MKKTIYTLNVGNYIPEITSLTIPLIKYYAKKINAEYYEITERKFPEWPLRYEKVQIYDLVNQRKDDWAFYFDCDVIVHPETVDWSLFLKKETILAGHDTMFANAMFTYDKYFTRDNRNIAVCNWFSVVSDWCIDFWKPLELSLEQSLNNIHLLATQINGVTSKEDLIDDYTVSRNLAKYGLKYTTAKEIIDQFKDLKGANFLAHIDNIIVPEKIKIIRETVVNWGLKKYIDLMQ